MRLHQMVPGMPAIDLFADAPVGNPEASPIGGNASYLGDFIEDKNAILPIDAAIQSNLRETTTRVLAFLSPREERVCSIASLFFLKISLFPEKNRDHGLDWAALAPGRGRHRQAY